MVRYGGDAKLPHGGHTAAAVYSEMLLQVARDYPGAPDIRTLRAHELRFLYNGLRAELKEHTKPK